MRLQLRIESEIGPLHLVASEKGLQGIFWKPQPTVPTTGTGNAEAEAILRLVTSELSSYFSGSLQRFSAPLDIQGSDFQKRVWAALQEIPFAGTCSYKQIALRIGDANASRAVGTANGQNPLSIIIPCHRVISSDGSLGGYAGGLEIKRTLLALEKSTAARHGLSTDFNCSGET